MKKELLLCGAVLCVLVGGIFILIMDDSVDMETASINTDVDESNQKVQRLESAPVSRGAPVVVMHFDPPPREKLRAHNEEVIESGELKIHALMEEYNNNLSNADIRTRIEKQLQEVSLDYKEEVLLKVRMLNIASK